MKLPIQVNPAPHVCFAFHLVSKLLRRVNVVTVRRCSRQPDSFGIEDLSQVMDFHELFIGYFLDNCASMGVEVDESFGREISQRLSDWSRTDAEVTRDIRLH